VDAWAIDCPSSFAADHWPVHRRPGVRAGNIKNGLLAALLPAILPGIIAGLPFALLIGLRIVGIVLGLSVAVVVALNIVGLLAGALLGAPIFGRRDRERLGEPGVQARKKDWR
jgi:hypothetical protein